MKKLLLIWMVSLACCGSITAQTPHWNYLDYYEDCSPAVAYVKIDDTFITPWGEGNRYEVAAFVGEECRGNNFMIDYTEEYGDPYPIIEMNIYYDYDTAGEPVSFKLYDHLLEIEYEFEGSSTPVVTGEEYMGVYFGEDELVLSFITPSSPVSTLELIDGEENSNAIATAVSSEDCYCVTLKDRTLWKDDCWNTLCLPFDVTDGDTGADNEDDETFTGTPLQGAEVMTLDNASFSMGTLTINFISVTAIEAGKPYIIKWPSDNNNIINPEFSDVTLKAATPTPIKAADDMVTFVGTYDYTLFTEKNTSTLFLGADNTLYYPKPDTSNAASPIYPSIGAFRAYFILNGIEAGETADNDGEVNHIVLNFGDESTGISINHSPSPYTTDSWYSLDGRRLNGKPTAKGLYIHNGHKMVNK